jgi:alpha-D-xyloside xylohydrolase
VELTVDPFVGARLVNGGRLIATLQSGDEVELTVTSPSPGVLRIRTNPTAPAGPMLIEFDGDAAVLWEEMDGGGVRATAAGVDATWGHDGSFAVGTLRRAPKATHVRAGRLSPGWIEAVELGPNDRLFGTGEAPNGPELRGRTRQLINRETHGTAGFDWTYLNVPFVWSDAGWGLFAKTGGPAVADMGATHAEVASLAIDDEDLDLFVIVGDGPTDVLARYLALTGLPRRFPEWALGVWSSRCSYLSEDELHEVVRGYRDADCPVDVVHVDAWVEGNVIAELTCNWTIDRDRFPLGWVDRLRAEGVRVSLWHNPYVLDGSARDDELAALGALAVDDDGKLVATADMTDRHVIDFTNPVAVEWWQQQVRRVMAEEHNEAFKPDFGEELPLDARLHDGRTGRAARNEYALRYQAATHEAMVESLGDEAIALFCRSGTAGAQRYPCHWVGDTPSTWLGLTSALRACLSLSLSGFAFVSHDIGGFWTGGSHAWVAEALAKNSNRDVPADVDPELFARWTQWGALSPVMRFHGTGRREPYAYAEPWRSVAIDACRLRARLRPYLARISAEASSIGTPLMRPVALTHPRSWDARAAELQYLLGPDLLVAPLLASGGSRTLWVPPGRWSPLLGLDAVEGPAWIDVVCATEQFPAWIREGADLFS